MCNKKILTVASLCLAVTMSYGCDDAVEGVDILSCKPATTKCENNMFKTCIGISWQSIPCPMGCDDAGKMCKLEAGQICIPGMQKCNATSTSVLTCDSTGKTENEKKCSSNKCELTETGAKCTSDGNDQSSQQNTECEPGLVKCSSDLSGTIACSIDGKWGQLEPCPEDQKCNPAMSGCEDTSVLTPVRLCDEGDFSCINDNQYTACEVIGKNTKWGPIKNCEINTTCDEEQKTCVPNENGDDTVTRKCRTGQKKCSDDEKGIVTCNAEGTWDDPEPCPNNGTCTANMCIDAQVEKECEEGDRKCSEDFKGTFSCNAEGKWETELTPCGQDEKCNDTLNACAKILTCTPGSVKCSEDAQQLITCSEEGEWETSDCAIDKEEYCIENACKKVDCQPNINYCTGKGSKLGIYKCTAEGKKGDLVKSCYSCTEDGLNCIDCKDGDAKCSDEGVFSICVNGEWKEEVNCGSSDNCKASKTLWLFGTLGCQCETGKNVTIQCDQTKSILQTCISTVDEGVKFNTWENTLSCGKDLCDDSGDKPFCRCEGTSYTCDENVLKQCDNGTLKVVKECNSKEVCDANAKACTCTNNDRVCTGDSYQVCQDQAWTSATKCKKSTCNDEFGTVCVSTSVCSNSKTTCLGGSVVTCRNNVYEVDEACEKFCNDGKCASACSKWDSLISAKRCSADFTSVINCKGGEVTKCEAGTRCEDGFWGTSCKKKVCDEFAITCNGNKIQYCDSNELIDIADCSAVGATCKNGKCV